jgi:hypothetical protein
VRSGVAPISREAFLATYDETVEHIRKTGEVPGDLPPAMQALFPRYLGPFFRSVFAIEPAALAPQYPGPVLMLRVFARLSHNFKPATGPADHAFAGPLPAEVSAALVDWLAAKLKASR